MQRALPTCPLLPTALAPTCQGHTPQVTGDRIVPLGFSCRPQTPAGTQAFCIQYLNAHQKSHGMLCHLPPCMWHSTAQHSKVTAQDSTARHVTAQRSTAQHLWGGGRVLRHWWLNLQCPSSSCLHCSFHAINTSLAPAVTTSHCPANDQ